jgi:hypothetical protein
LPEAAARFEASLKGCNALTDSISVRIGENGGSRKTANFPADGVKPIDYIINSLKYRINSARK